VLGFLLAGGKAHRFGADKALHPVEGVPMALRVATAMREAGLEVVAVAKDRRLEELGIPCLVEPDEPRHPLVGVVLGLRQGGGVFAPCDVPWIPAQAFVRLAAAPGSIARDEGGLHPLLAHYPADWLARAEDLLERRKPARHLGDGAARIDLPSAWLRNVNRVEDL
jgi:molybdopterin-guanine dinucleotide biosynthesis protein A